MLNLRRIATALVVAALPAVTAVVTAQDVPPEIMACIANGTKIGHSFVQHPDAAKLKDAVKAYETRSANYPEGTIIRMIPGEAMVKRAAGAFPQSNGWEYFALAVTPQGTTVRARGMEAGNPLGTCQSCHSGAKSDYVCASGGCANVPLTEERIAQIQAADPRCAK
ncbi:MAG: hypothetical protein AB7H96_22570 [Vicinamibacterales bacterium]